MIYCDASLLVAMIVREVHSDHVDLWMQRQTGGTLVISPWVMTEVGSALAMKRRRGLLDEAAWTTATVLAGEFADNVFRSLPVESAHFTAAGVNMVHAGKRGLRAGDALHLAIAAAHDAHVASLDTDMMDAAASIGLGVEPVSLAS